MPMTYHTGWRRPNPKHHVFIAVPSYKDMPAGFVTSLLSAQGDLINNSISGDIVILSGDCHVDDARNNLCRRFLMSDATHFVFIDADLQFSHSAISKLLSFNEKFIAGIYPFKNDDEGYPVLLGGHKFDERGLIKVEGVPGGFMVIAREVIQKLYDDLGDSWNVKGDKPGMLPVKELFHRVTEQGVERRSGDYQFCKKVREAGFEIWAAPFLKFGHIGEKTWTGSVQDFWLRQSGDYEKDAAEVVKELRANKDAVPTPAAFQKLAQAFGNQPWAIDPVMLSVIFDLARGKKKVLETGSGVSTLVLRLASPHVVSLESEPIWGSKTERLLKKVGIDGRVAYAPIVFHKELMGMWYDAAHLDDKYDFVLIDGPRREDADIRGRICDIMPKALTHAKVILVDDVDDASGVRLLGKLHDRFGFVFDIHNGPRRQFAVGTKEDAA
jgi:predicted O-methyltransferase YrrM